VSQLRELPEGWIWASLEQIADIQGGIQKQPKRQPQKNVFPYLRVANVLRNKLDLTEVHEIELFGDELEKLRLKTGDLLVVEGNGSPSQIGRMAVWDGSIKNCVHQNHIIRARLSDQMSPAFVAAYWNSQEGSEYVKQVASSTSGLYTLNVSKVGHLSVPVIPLAEQHRIVAEIDTQFTRLDAVVIALKRVQTNLKRYRASVLKAACTGHLVPTEAELTRAEGRSYESADQLLQRILQSRRAEWEAEQLAAMQAAGKAPKDDKWKSKYRESVKPDTSELPELPEGWVWSSLGAIAGVQLGKMLSPKAYEDGLLQLPYLRNENIRWGWINFDDIKKMGFKKHELERYSIEPYDLIVCEGGEAGRCAVYTGVAGQFMYQKALHRVRPVGHLVIPYFIQFCIQHYVHSGTVIPKPSETTIQHLPLEKMQILPIPLPPLDEQHRIVAEVERRLSVIDELEATIATNLKRADRLRQAILKRAFEGNLVPQDPTDEPASVLLARIRAEHEQAREKPKATPQQTNAHKPSVQPKAATPVQGELALEFRE